MRFDRSTFSALTLLSLATALAGCGAPASTTETTGASTQDLACPAPERGGVQIEGCAPIGTPAPPIILPPHAPTFPSVADPVCPTGSTCTYTPTEMTTGSGLPCTAPYWLTESGTISAFHMVMYCTVGIGVYASAIPNWLAANSDLQPVEIASQPGLPDAPSGTIYVQFLPPIPALSAFPDLSSYPAGTLTPEGVPLYGRIPTDWLPCTQLFSSTNLNASSDLYVSPDVMLCVPSQNLLAWVAQSPATECLVTSKACKSAALSDGSDADLLPAPFGYVYVEYSTAGGPIGGGCETGCANPHY